MSVIFYVLFCMIAGLLGVALGYWIRKKETEKDMEYFLKACYRSFLEASMGNSEEEKSE